MSNNNKSNLKIVFKLKESVTAPLVRDGASVTTLNLSTFTLLDSLKSTLD